VWERIWKKFGKVNNPKEPKRKNSKKTPVKGTILQFRQGPGGREVTWRRWKGGGRRCQIKGTFTKRAFNKKS